MTSQIYRVIIIPDLQIPFEDTKTLSVVEKFMADYRWDEYVNLGDLMDFDMISKFNAQMLRNLETRRILKDYDRANAILDRHQEIVKKNNKHAKFTLLEGNHEYRIEVLVNKAPQLEGMVEVDKCLRLEQRGFKWVRAWSGGELHKIGKLYFHHGIYTSKYHASKMVDSFGVNMVYGHTHDRQAYGKTTHGDKNPIMATSLGHLSDMAKLDYMRSKPSNWIQCIGVCEIRPNGDFNLTPIDIINHTFSYNGKVYV